MHRQVLPVEHPDVAISLGTLASVYCALGNETKALELLRETLAIQTRVLHADHPSLATTMANTAIVLTTLRVFDEAHATGMAALAFRRRVLAPTHKDIAHSLGCLAYTYFHQGDVTNAIYMQAQCLRHLEEDISRPIPNLAAAKEKLAVMQRCARAGSAGVAPDVVSGCNMRPAPSAYPPVGMFNDGYSMSM